MKVSGGVLQEPTRSDLPEAVDVRRHRGPEQVLRLDFGGRDGSTRFGAGRGGACRAAFEPPRVAPAPSSPRADRARGDLRGVVRQVHYHLRAAAERARAVRNVAQSHPPTPFGVGGAAESAARAARPHAVRRLASSPSGHERAERGAWRAAASDAPRRPRECFETRDRLESNVLTFPSPQSKGEPQRQRVSRC